MVHAGGRGGVAVALLERLDDRADLLDGLRRAAGLAERRGAQHGHARLQAAGERTYTWEDDLYLSTIAREAIIQAWQAVENDLYRTIGSSAAKKGQRFERVFRDLAMAAGHRNTMMRDPLVRQLAQLRLGVVPAGMQR